SAKRTTERNGVIAGVFQPSASRAEKSSSVRPSAKALGYSHSVRFADAEKRLLQQSRGASFIGAGGSFIGGRSLDGAGRSLDGAGRSLDGAGRSLDGAGRSLDGAGRSLDGA